MEDAKNYTTHKVKAFEESQGSKGNRGRCQAELKQKAKRHQSREAHRGCRCAGPEVTAPGLVFHRKTEHFSNNLSNKWRRILLCQGIKNDCSAYFWHKFLCNTQKKNGVAASETSWQVMWKEQEEGWRVCFLRWHLMLWGTLTGGGTGTIWMIPWECSPSVVCYGSAVVVWRPPILKDRQVFRGTTFLTSTPRAGLL